ncbi:Catalase OS=Streptomyces fumanus OX=67302 GN=katA PE=3 SV=1 [Streptomyces fumanus]
MTSAETGGVTGTQDKDYNLVWYVESCLSNALRLESYIKDAEREKDTEVAELFRKAQADSRNDYLQAGQRYCLMEQWERDDLVKNFVNLLSQCPRPIQERMVWHFLLVENDLGLRVGEGIGISPEDVAGLEPLASQDLTDEDRKRLADLGNNPPRDVEGLTMTHCVPDERHVVTR